MSKSSAAPGLLKPLKITCTQSDCENDLHCFKQTRKMAAANLGGQCRSCGADLVDWNRVHQNSVADAAYTITALKYELIRHHFWHKDIDQKAENHARRKGKAGLRTATENRLHKYVAPSMDRLPFDGRQTPLEGNVIYYAQHATATCCRKCLEEWHGIPKERELTDEEIEYFADLIMLYIEDRLPLLTENGEKIPQRRHPKS